MAVGSMSSHQSTVAAAPTVAGADAGARTYVAPKNGPFDYVDVVFARRTGDILYWSMACDQQPF
jgi:hypothetical protein